MRLFFSLIHAPLAVTRKMIKSTCLKVFFLCRHNINQIKREHNLYAPFVFFRYVSIIRRLRLLRNHLISLQVHLHPVRVQYHASSNVSPCDAGHPTQCIPSFKRIGIQPMFMFMISLIIISFVIFAIFFTSLF
mgnify:CR=1 FL=1